MKSEKVTNSIGTATKRWYDDACGTALALEFVGERWSLLVIRELMFGPRRFGELRAHLVGISANVLTQRLEGLEAAGIVLKRRLPSPANVQVYDLTPWGREVEPIFQAMGRWSTRSRRHDPTLPLSPASAMLSLRTMIVPERAAGLHATVGFRLSGDSFVGVLHGGTLDIRREEATGVDVVFDCDPTTFVTLVYGKRPFEDAERAGTLRIDGDRALAERFVGLFDLPDKVD